MFLILAGLLWQTSSRIEQIHKAGLLLEHGPQHRVHHQLVLFVLLALSIGLPILRYCLVDVYTKTTQTYWITLGLINAS